jgi:hypothetical protein
MVQAPANDDRQHADANRNHPAGQDDEPQGRQSHEEAAYYDDCCPSRQANDEEKTGDVLYKGIAERTFEPSFQLADHVVVKGARLENGLLHVDLEREIPEAMKPRVIPIASSGKVLEVQPTKAAA